MAIEPTILINGWTVLLHPMFVQQVALAVAEVQKARTKDPVGFRKKNSAKRLKAILKLAFVDIPANPANFSFRLGATLGADYTHWFRAKFFQQYRLFFRYDAARKIIILGWVNDEKTKRAYGSHTDAYAVFSDMLDAGNPPNSWATLKLQCDEDRIRRQHAGEADPLAAAKALIADE